MGTPTNRTPLRVARGTTSALNTGLSDIQEGEIVWDATLNKLQVKESSALVSTTAASDAAKANLAGATFTGNVNLGVDDTGVDCKFFGATSGAYVLWDESADSLLTGGGATIDIVKDKLKIGGTAVTTTAAELNILDGVTSTAAELNKLDGFTGDKDDLIYAKDLKATGVTTTEFDYLDGVTSAIQTQLDAKGVGDATKAGTNNWTGVNSNTPEVVSSASSITIDLSTSNNFILTTGHGTIAFANPTTEIAGASGSIFIVQGSTTCAAPSWGDQWLFPGGTAPSFTGTTGKIGRVDYIVQEAGKIHCVATDNLVLTS